MSMRPEAVVLEQAAAWRARLTESPAQWTGEFREWLARDPRNAEAWRSVQSPWLLVGEHASSPALLRLRRKALEHAHEAGQRQQTPLKQPWFQRSVGAAAAVFALALTAVLTWQMYSPDIYSTRTGERRVVTLSDGSEIALDSKSEVQVRFGRHSRELVLVTGQARFQVAHDILRPFTVMASGQAVVATGTQFNVDILGPDLLVTLIEGHVVVLRENAQASHPAPAVLSTAGSSDPGLSSRINLDAGEQLVISPRTVPVVSRVDVQRATAWETGQLVFENEPLSTVVTRVNRYAAHPLVVADERTSNLRISGVFHQGDIAGFVSTIASYLPVHAQEDADGSIRLSAKNSDDPLSRD